jgi:NAD(P)-dependent dehydrogenase (short-subunit alcohol dehydrogenase family)
MTVNGRLAGKVVVITGAGSGIGLAIAERFYAEGASVVIADISGNEKVVAKNLGERAIAVHVDVAQSADIQAMLKVAVDRFGGVDILVNNAGIDGDMYPIADITEETFERVIAINLRGVFLGMKYAIPLMKKRGGGSIINISSTAGLVGARGLGVYGATKAGVIQLAKAAAIEYATDKVRVNAICPAATATPLVAHLAQAFPAEFAKGMALHPMNRPAQPIEIANAALFLASDESSYVTGIAMPVDGAYTAI